MADHRHVQYKVLHTHKSTQPNDQGGFHNVFTTHYESPSGTRSFVETPEHLYTARNVHEQIMDEMQHVEGVHALQPNAPVPDYPPTQP